ncbi:DUF2846 domain-containing protein [Acidimangrovimonas pyrenivorans]|uniref:DUF2846 domain-containing protein n=1 Tax=Acidimangrovimonas pyrenivorans TaxID=2030798 RepID=A0ABV7ACC0_9RHOB
MFRIASVIPVALLAAACVPETGPATAPPANAPPQVQEAPLTVPRNKAVVYFYRPANFVGSANIYRIAINGAAIADIRSGTRYAAVTAPGTVQIAARTQANFLNIGLAHAMMEKPDLTLSTKGGTVTYVRITTGFAGGPKLQLVPEETARPELPKLGQAATVTPEG